MSTLYLPSLNCGEHTNQVLDLYCCSHEEPACSKCIYNRHKSCGNIIPLTDATRKGILPAAFIGLDQEGQEIFLNLQDIIENKKQNKTNLYTDKQTIKATIRGIRSKINQHLDNIEKELLDEVSNMYKQCKDDIQQFILELESQCRDIMRIRDTIKDSQRLENGVHVFLAAREIKRRIYEQEQNLRAHFTDERIKEMSIVFSANSNFIPTINSSHFGSFSTSTTPATVVLSTCRIQQAQNLSNTIANTKLIPKAVIGFPASSYRSYVTGCTIRQNGDLVFADKTNKRLLIFGSDGFYRKTVEVPGEPYDVTTISTDRLALTYEDENINALDIVDITNYTYNRVKSISLPSNCYGIALQGNRLFTRILHEGIRISDLEGRKIKSIEIGRYGIIEDICAHNDRIYYTNPVEGTVYCLTTDGKVLWTYRSATLKRPRSITVDSNGNVFVIGLNMNNLVVISKDGRNEKELLSPCDLLPSPWALHYNKNSNLLLVVTDNSNEAILYDVL